MRRLESTNRSSLDSSSLGDSLDSEIPSTHRRPSYALSAFNTNNHNTSTKMSVAQQQQHAAGHDEDEDTCGLPYSTRSQTTFR